MSSDFSFILQWWFQFLIIGFVFLPLTSILFSNFFDRGYIFSKILGILFISYVIFLFGSLKLLPFTQTAIFIVLAALAIINIFVFVKIQPYQRWNLLKSFWKIFVIEELIFFSALLFWSYIRAHEPSIHGLEKYMDFGFISSILRSDYFPPADMWYTPLPVNYYYFGHLVTAVLTKLSGIDSIVTYNLMLATLFAFTFTCSFSIGANLVAPRGWPNGLPRGGLIAGLLTAFLVSMAGNLHTIYAFFQAYNVEHPVPFWQLVFSQELFPNGYWYPNATRFIINTIHEFPLYSFVVSDLHGHVLDIPVVLLMIALLLSLISKFQALNPKQIQNTNSQNSRHLELLKFGDWKLFRIWDLDIRILLLAFLLAVMYMTNIWDAAIYGGLTFLVFLYLAYQARNYTLYIIRYTFIIALAIILTLPFSLNFTPFASGIGILCAPAFLTSIGKLGPFLFEPNHCQQSPIWQLIILYGFFYFWVILFLFRNLKGRASRVEIRNLPASDIFVLLLIIVSTLLIIVPELAYAKDIYPAHYRANTMFKLGYQAFMMLSIVSGYVIVRLITPPRWLNGLLGGGYWKLAVFVIGSIGILLVSVYPFFAIGSYYGDLKTYRGLDGLSYLKSLYPNDYEAILWLRNNIKGQPVILEANGESYTDYARLSANTGLPTVIGWPVHEWLWRGSYDYASPRITDVQTLYETKDINLAKELIKKYKIELVFVGDLERQKYPSLHEAKFSQLGKTIYQNGQTKIYLLFR